MIGVSAACRAILDNGNHIIHVAVSSWLGGELLAENLPVHEATEEVDTTLRVPEKLTLSLPRRDRGVNWMPATTTDPLAAAGQTLKVAVGVELPFGTIEWFQRGEYVIVTTKAVADTVEVTAAGKLYLVQEAGFVQPFQPTGTIAGTLRALIEPALSADLTVAPDDRAVPSTVNWESRIDAVYELLDAWPAIGYVNRLGQLQVEPDTVPTVATRSFTTAYPGTVVEAAGTSTRDGGFNVVVATGQADDGGEIRGAAYVTDGPWAYGVGPANPLPVPFGYASPLLRTIDQANQAAATVLRRKRRAALARRFEVACVPDPTVQARDCIALTTDTVTGLLCTVERIQLPLLPGTMTMQVVSTT